MANIADFEKLRTAREMSPRQRRDFERLNSLAGSLNKAAKGAGSLVLGGLFGEDSGNSLPVSMIPGADLATKFFKGKAPGLLDLPGPSMLKAGVLGIGVPLAKEIMERAGYKLAKDAGESAAVKVGKELAKRTERLPGDLAESVAATAGRKLSPYPGFQIPTVSKGASLSTGKGMKSYYNGYGGGASNNRQVWVNPGLSPEEQARELMGRLGGNATVAELTKFGRKDPKVFTELGLRDQGNYGNDIMEAIYSKNRGLFDEMRKYGEDDSFRRIADYLSKMQGNDMLRYAQKGADLKAEGIDELSDLFRSMSGGVPLKNLIEGSGRNASMMALLSGEAKKSNFGDALTNPASRKMKELVASMNDSYPANDLYKLLAAGGMKANSPTMARKFSDLGGLDFERIGNEMLTTMMKTVTDRGNSVPLRNGFDKTMKDLIKAAGNDPRQRKFGRVRSIDFDELFK